VGGDLKGSLPLLLPLLQDANVQVRQTAYQILWRAGPDAIPHLAEGLKAKEPIIRQMALQSLAQLKVADDNLLKPLVQMAKDDPDQNVRGAAYQALIMQGPKQYAQVEMLLKSEKEPTVIASAISTIGNQGIAAKGFVPLVIAALKDPSPTVRWNAAQALRNLGPDAKQAIPELAKLLDDENYNVRQNSVQALMNMTPESGSALALGLKSKDLNIRNQCLNAFANNKLQVKAPDAVPLLIEMLKDTAPFVRLQAARALGNFGPEAKDAIPALTKLTLDPNVAVRNNAQQALQKIQGK
jgi:HEAT repeat protein